MSVPYPIHYSHTFRKGYGQYLYKYYLNLNGIFPLLLLLLVYTLRVCDQPAADMIINPVK